MTSKKEQYEAGGPFEKWLRTVKTCRSRIECCPVAGYGNIIIRDFVDRPFILNVVNKNFASPSGDELQCEIDELEKEENAAAAAAGNSQKSNLTRN